jgi:cytochrome c biogenesis protein CcmG, thiol:disulfide interchange protein DsbE
MEPKIDLSSEAKKRSVPVWAVILAFAILIGFLTVLGLSLQRNQVDPITIGQTVPDIRLTTFDNQVLSTADYRGKVVVINFWASWCNPCKQEAKELEMAWEKYQNGGDVIFLGVDYVDTEVEARQYLSEFQIRYPNGPDLETSISHLFHISGVPETYFIDRNGKLAYVQIGPFNSAGDIQSVIDGLLPK